ncbi:MAG: MMPL family transporter [Treponema sp.]|jgi:predicted RND superfamily exporter protein|nr:MMPL family transporter [Treponema sp.]
MKKIFKYPWLIVAVTACITIFFAFQLPRAELDNNNRRFIPKDDSARLITDYIDETFGSTHFILVGLEREYGTVFDREFLFRLRSYVERIEEIAIVGEVNSLMTTDYITGNEDSILVEPLVPDDFSGGSEEIAALKQRFLSWDMYRRSLISDDFTATQILIPLELDPEESGNPEVDAAFVQIRGIAREMFDGLAKVYVTGMPAVSASINESVKADLLLLIPLVIMVTLVIVYLPLRNITMVALSILGVILAVIWSVGAMPLLGIKLSIISTVLPVILIAVGNSYGLHVIIHYVEDADADFSVMTWEAHREMIFTLVRTIRRPVALAALTTMVSFFSFSLTQVPPIREFGYFAGFGVCSAFLINLILIPALLIIMGPRVLGKIKQRSAKERRASRYLVRFFSSLVKRRYLIIGTAAVLLLVSLYGASRLVIDNVMLEYFRPATDIRMSDAFMQEKFGGSKVIDLAVQADSPEMLLHPAVLGAVDDLSAYLSAKVPETGKVMGFTDMVKRINQVFNAGESPEGLAARNVPADSGEWASGFGFGADDPADSGFGFGAFADAPDSDGPSEPAAPLREAMAVPAEDDAATPLELAGLLDRALGAGDGLAMDVSALAWELKRLTNYDGAAYYEIPRDPQRYGKTRPEELQQLVSNYLVLLAGDIDSYSNDPLEPTAIRTMVQLRTTGQIDTGRVLDVINGFVQANFPDTVRVEIGGITLEEASLNRLVVQSLWSSIIIALISLFVIMSLTNRSAVAGLLSVAPLGLLMITNFAIMGFAGIKLNIGTAMISSLSMGIGIDYTVHFLEAYKRSYRASGGRGNFLQSAYRTCGQAILADAAATGLGFAVLLFSQFNMLAELGLMIALAMGLSALVGLILVPALLGWIKPRFVRGDSDQNASPWGAC